MAICGAEGRASFLPGAAPGEPVTRRIDEIENHGLRALYTYWRKGRIEGRPMQRQALDPLEIRSLLANIVLAEVVDDGADLRIRLAGDEIESRYGLSLRGLSIRETFSMVSRQDTSHQWFHLLLDGRPRYRCGPMLYPDDMMFISERLLLPLSGANGEISHVLGGIYYLPLSPSAVLSQTLDLVIDD
jgi:hypothetical protein